MRRMHAVVNSYSFKYHLNLFFPARCSINNIICIIWVCCAAAVCIPHCTAGRLRRAHTCCCCSRKTTHIRLVIMYYKNICQLNCKHTYPIIYIYLYIYTQGDF